MEAIENALAEIQKKEAEIQELLTVIADLNGESVQTSREFFANGRLWAEFAAKNKELIEQ